MFVVTCDAFSWLIDYDHIAILTFVSVDAVISFCLLTTWFIDMIVLVAVEALYHSTVLHISFTIFDLMLYEKFFDYKTIDHDHRRYLHTQEWERFVLFKYFIESLNLRDF